MHQPVNDFKTNKNYFKGHRGSFGGGKAPWGQVHRSIPSSVHVKNEWSYTSTPLHACMVSTGTTLPQWPIQWHTQPTVSYTKRGFLCDALACWLQITGDQRERKVYRKVQHQNQYLEQRPNPRPLNISCRTLSTRRLARTTDISALFLVGGRSISAVVEEQQNTTSFNTWWLPPERQRLDFLHYTTVREVAAAVRSRG